MVRTGPNLPVEIFTEARDTACSSPCLLPPHHASSTALPLMPICSWWPPDVLCPLLSSIPESVRILGSLLAILLLFALTAALVKVDLSPGLFFSVTMASVWFINCKYISL